MARVDHHGGDDGCETGVEVLGEGGAVLRRVRIGSHAGKSVGGKLALDQRKRLLMARHVCGQRGKDVVELLGGRPV